MNHRNELKILINDLFISNQKTLISKLIKEREELENNLLQIRKKNCNSIKKEIFLKQTLLLNSEEDKISYLTLQIADLDQRIDGIEYQNEKLNLLSETPLDELKILESRKFLSRLSTLQKHQDYLKEIKTRFDRLFRPLNEAFNILKVDKKRSIFDYFFGRHPKVVLACHFFIAEKAALNLITWLKLQFHEKDLIFQTSIETLFSVTQDCLKELQKVWNPKLYTLLFCDQFEKVSKLRDKYNEHECFLEQEKQKLLEEVRLWIFTI